LIGQRIDKKDREQAEKLMEDNFYALVSVPTVSKKKHLISYYNPVIGQRPVT
jgi:hypothetical protein